MSAPRDARPAPSAHRRLVFWLALAAIPIVFVATTAEVALRIQLARRLDAVREMAGYFETLFEWDPEIGAVHARDVAVTLAWPEAPGGRITLRTNDHGFRDDAPVEVPKRRPRVIVFGDSHTDGFLDNRDAFVEVAERHLRAGGLDAELLNAGTSTHSLYAEYLMFRRHLALEPDVAVFAFYVGNDFEELIAPTRAHVAFEDGRPVGRPAGPTNRLPDVYARLEAMIRAQHAGPSLLVDWLRERLGAAAPRAAMPREESIPIFAQGLSQAVLFRRSPALYDAAARANEWVIGEILALADAHDVPVLFVLIPTRRQVERAADAARFALVEAATGLGAEPTVDDRIRADVRASLAARGVPVVDPHDAFAGHFERTGEALYYDADHHLAGPGHRELGRRLADALAPMLGTRRPDD